MRYSCTAWATSTRTFDEDARLAARDLEIVLTQRDMGQGEVVPLAGIPYHALDSYLAKLVRKGHRVAIAEQTSEPDGRTLVSRDVVRVVTPGTVIEPGMLDSGANNYLVAVAQGGVQSGVAFVDITTGEFAVTQLPTGAIPQEIARLAPSELLLAESDATSFPAETPDCHVTRLNGASFAPNAARRRVLDHFGVRSLDAFGCEGLEFATARGSRRAGLRGPNAYGRAAATDRAADVLDRRLHGARPADPAEPRTIRRRPLGCKGPVAPERARLHADPDGRACAAALARPAASRPSRARTPPGRRGVAARIRRPPPAHSGGTGGGVGPGAGGAAHRRRRRLPSRTRGAAALARTRPGAARVDR